MSLTLICSQLSASFITPGTWGCTRLPCGRGAGPGCWPLTIRPLTCPQSHAISAPRPLPWAHGGPYFACCVPAHPMVCLPRSPLSPHHHPSTLQLPSALRVIWPLLHQAGHSYSLCLGTRCLAISSPVSSTMMSKRPALGSHLPRRP